MMFVATANREFRKFFIDFLAPVTHFIERYAGEKEEANDIAQEAFVKVYEKWEEFDTAENARAFLYVAVRNLCLDHLKHKRAEANYLSQCRTAEEAADPAFLREVMRQETFRILREAINRLPKQTRQVVLLALEENTNAEIAGKLGISVNTVKTLKKNAYTSLRHFLSREYLIILLLLLGK